MKEEEIILEAIKDKRNHRKDIAVLYANLIFATRNEPDRDISRVNIPIINRWSRSGLEYIKNTAWKLIEMQSH